MLQVLAACDIVELVGAHVELKPGGGGRFKGLCPFHNERTPSFTVSRDRQMFHCFGCGASGDAISFLSRHEGLTFVEALQRLADRGGVKLPASSRFDATEDTQRLKLLELGKIASRHFQTMLHEPTKGEAGRRYLESRRLRPETVKRFELGYAPEGRSLFYEASRAAGHPDALLEVSGLARRNDRGQFYDFFRNRLMFPIHDASGNVAAFGGRDLSGESPAKYINTPENPVYKKGRILYGLFQARDALRKSRQAILVEGYFDLLRCVDAGFENVVASCGTALTADQASLIRRYVPEVVIVYDGDAAGIRAALRGVAVLSAVGLTVRAMVLPGGRDPDDFIKEEGADAFREKLHAALDFVTFYIRTNEERIGTIEGRTDIARELFTILLGVDDELRREQYFKRIARELGLSEYVVRSEFAKRLQEREHMTSITARNAEPESRATTSPDDVDFLATLLEHASLLNKTRQALHGVELLPGPFTDVLKELLAETTGPDTAQNLTAEEAKTLYAEAATKGAPEPDRAAILVDRRIARLKKEALRARAEKIQEALREAERLHDTARVMILITERIGVIREMERVGAE